MFWGQMRGCIKILLLRCKVFIGTSCIHEQTEERDAGAYENCRRVRRGYVYVDRPTRDNIDRRWRPAERHGSVLTTVDAVPVDIARRTHSDRPGTYIADYNSV